MATTVSESGPVSCVLCGMTHDLYSITCKAPVNIAVIKYWGKSNEELILPMNNSLSVTLSHDQMCSRTTVAASPEFSEDYVCINGREENINNKRVQAVLNEIRKRGKLKHKKGPVRSDWNMHICSVNNFPTAAGLASSAAGYACMAFALGKLFNLQDDLSAVARLGSGSACRSMLGGFVEWVKGTKPDGSDSIAVPVASETHWPELNVLILVVNSSKKVVSSTSGMQVCAETSDLLRYRIEHTVSDRLEKLKSAILNKDFDTFAEITMKDSNEMHACCLDTVPPISYMNDTSRHIQSLVHWLNKSPEHEQINGCKSNYMAAYTFDAGPNAVLFVLEENLPTVKAAVEYFYQEADTSCDSSSGKCDRSCDSSSGKCDRSCDSSSGKSDQNSNKFSRCPLSCIPDGVEMIIHTKVGGAPQVESSGCLLEDIHKLSQDQKN